MAKLNNVEFSQLLTETAKTAAKLFELQTRVNAESIARYGLKHEDSGSENLTLVLDGIGAESMTAKQFDDEMTKCGHARVDIVNGRPLIEEEKEE